jgi:hypothetical protein
MDNDIDQWLQSLPMGHPIEIDGETVYLNVRPEGAELGAYVCREYTPAQLQQAMKVGFQSALEYDAGLGQVDNTLVLTQWLPHTRNWTDAAEPLESLLNQVAMWRSRLDPQPQRHVDTTSANRTEQRLRKLFAGTR